MYIFKRTDRSNFEYIGFINGTAITRKERERRIEKITELNPNTDIMIFNLKEIRNLGV